MPGPDKPMPPFKDSDAVNRLLCPKCNSLLNKPVQPSCGHRICQSCADDILESEEQPRCPECEELFDDEDGAYVSIHIEYRCVSLRFDRACRLQYASTKRRISFTAVMLGDQNLALVLASSGFEAK